MKRMHRALWLGCFALAPAVQAEVLASSPTHFIVRHRVEHAASGAQVVEALGQVGRWWNGEHTYSGQAGNLRLGLRAGDCFCEQWEGHSIEHARVLYVRRDAMVRLHGALGPLQALGAQGVLDIGSVSADGKRYLQLNYRVSGSPDMKLDQLAAVVDREQFHRLANFVTAASP